MKTELRQINLQKRIWTLEDDLKLPRSSSVFEDDYNPASFIESRHNAIIHKNTIYHIIIMWIIYVATIICSWILSVLGGAWLAPAQQHPWGVLFGVIAILGSIGILGMLSITFDLLDK